MLANSSLVTFLATTDATKAHAFYGGLLELQFISEDDFAVIYDASGVSLRIQKVASFLPQPFTVLGWSVMSIERTVEKLLEKGVTFERYASLEQDSRGIWSSPSGAKVVWLKDPDGTSFPSRSTSTRSVEPSFGAVRVTSKLAEPSTRRVAPFGFDATHIKHGSSSSVAERAADNRATQVRFLTGSPDQRRHDEGRRQTGHGPGAFIACT